MRPVGTLVLILILALAMYGGYTLLAGHHSGSANRPASVSSSSQTDTSGQAANQPVSQQSQQSQQQPAWTQNRQSTGVTSPSHPSTGAGAAVQVHTASETLDQMVAKLNCSGPCAGRFAPLKEGNGVINPTGVFLQTGTAVALDLPPGATADVWDCFSPTEATGPVHLAHVCQASIRGL